MLNNFFSLNNQTYIKKTTPFKYHLFVPYLYPLWEIIGYFGVGEEEYGTYVAMLFMNTLLMY